MPTEIEQLKQRVEFLEKKLNFFFRADRFLFQRDIEFGDSLNIRVSGNTGTKIATTSTQKLGFFGKTPVTRRTAPAAPVGGATVDGEARGVINDLRTVLSDLGLTG